MPVEPTQPHGEVFLDARGHGRALRLTWHHESDVVVLSLWRDRICAGTFRLSTADVGDFVDALVEGLRDGPADTGIAAVPHSAAIDAAVPVAFIEPVETVEAVDTVNSGETDEADEMADGFVEWALRSGGGRATA
jgi:hypothetical protein